MLADFAESRSEERPDQVTGDLSQELPICRGDHTHDTGGSLLHCVCVCVCAKGKQGWGPGSSELKGGGGQLINIIHRNRVLHCI